MAIQSIPGFPQVNLNLTPDGGRSVASQAKGGRASGGSATPGVTGDNLKLALSRIANAMGVSSNESIQFVIDENTKEVSVKVVDIYGQVIHLFPSKQALAIAQSSDIYSGIFLSEKA